MDQFCTCINKYALWSMSHPKCVGKSSDNWRSLFFPSSYMACIVFKIAGVTLLIKRCCFSSRHDNTECCWVCVLTLNIYFYVMQRKDILVSSVRIVLHCWIHTFQLSPISYQAWNKILWTHSETWLLSCVTHWQKWNNHESLCHYPEFRNCHAVYP